MSEWISVEDRLSSLIEATFSAVPFLVVLENEYTPKIGYFYIGWDYPW